MPHQIVKLPSLTPSFCQHSEGYMKDITRKSPPLGFVIVLANPGVKTWIVWIVIDSIELELSLEEIRFKACTL